MIPANPEWIWNRYAWRWMAGVTAAMGVGAIAFLGLVSLFVLHIPPLSWLVAVGILGVTLLTCLVCSQPLRVGFRDDRLLVHWLWKTDVVILGNTQEAVLSLMVRHVERVESRRLYTVLITVGSGRPVSLGNVGGPIATRILGVVPPDKVRLIVYGRGGHGEFHVKR